MSEIVPVNEGLANLLKGGMLPKIEVSGDKDMIQADDLEVIHLALQVNIVAQLASIRESLQREHIEGYVVEKVLDATEEPKVLYLLLEYPYAPWATVSAFNEGPGIAYISWNSLGNWTELKPKQKLDADFTKAEKRLEVIHYKSSPGNALVTVKGKY